MNAVMTQILVRRLAIGTVMGILTSACSSPTTSSVTAPPVVTLHAEVTDPVGDAIPASGVAIPPDLVHGTADVSNGSIVFTVQFAPRTMDPATTFVGFELDTDQNPATGIPAGNVGIDYHVSFRASATVAIIERATPATCVPAIGSTCYTNAGSASVVAGADTITVTVSLALLGNSSGRMNYRVYAYAALPNAAPTTVADAMPDENLPPAHVP